MSYKEQSKRFGNRFAIEFVNKNVSNTPEQNKMMTFEATTIHDRKLWLQKLKDATDKYQEKVDLEKSRKYSGMNVNKF